MSREERAEEYFFKKPGAHLQRSTKRTEKDFCFEMSHEYHHVKTDYCALLPYMKNEQHANDATLTPHALHSGCGGGGGALNTHTSGGGGGAR